MSDQTVRLLELKAEPSSEFGLPEIHTLIGRAARAMLRIESLTVRICAIDLATDDYITTSHELSAVEAQLAEICGRARKLAPPEPLKVVYFERTVCPKCGEERERPAEPLERSVPAFCRPRGQEET